MNNDYMIIAIIIMAMITYAMRIAPLVLFQKYKNHHQLLCRVQYLPPVILTVLLVYSLSDIQLTQFPFGLPDFLALAFMLVLHVFRCHSLVVLFSGIGVYGLLTIFVF